MPHRTTIEIDEHLLARAKRALGLSTTRETFEEALREAAGAAEHEQRAASQRAYFHRLAQHADPSVLASEELWR